MSTIAAGRGLRLPDEASLARLALVVVVLSLAFMSAPSVLGQRSLPPPPAGDSPWGGGRGAGGAGGFLDAPPFVLCGGVGVVDGAEPLRAAGAPPRPTAQIVSSEPLAHVPGKRVTAAVVTFPPGSVSPPHVHGGSVTVYVLNGTVRSQLGNGPIETFTPGGTFFEPLGIVHTHSSNPSMTEPAQILAVFVHDEGATLTTYLE